MPAGNVHLKVNSTAATMYGVGVVGVWAYGGISLGMLAAFFLGCIAGMLITPDMDVDSGNYTYYLIRRYIGRVGRYVFKTFWEPYALAIKHRSPLSHGPVIGTLIRFVYLFFPILIVLINESRYSNLTILLWSIPAQILAIPMLMLMFFGVTYGIITLPTLVIFLIAWSILDTLHELLDRIF